VADGAEGVTDDQRDLVELFNGLDHAMLVGAFDRYLARFGKQVAVVDPVIRLMNFCDDLSGRVGRIEALLGARPKT
jgi:hypothetical protein